MVAGEEKVSENRTPAAVIPPNEVITPPVKRARGARMGVLIGPEQGAANFITRRFLLAPGARIPAHSHPTIEHEQVMVRGEMVLGADGEVRTVRPRRDVPSSRVRALVREPHRGGGRVPLHHPQHPGYETDWAEEPPEGAFFG